MFFQKDSDKINTDKNNIEILYGTAVLLEEVGKVIAEGGSGVTISSQSGWRMSQLTAEEDALLATTPTEELLDLEILKPENIKDTLHAYQMAKRCIEKRVMAQSVEWGKRGATSSYYYGPLKPEIPYTQGDLDWMDKNARSTVEMHDKTYRPAIAEKVEDMSKYDTVFIGFPIWWYVAPMIINTFLEAHDMSGKTIIPFATSGGSDFGNTVEELNVSCNESAVWKKGKLLNGRVSADTLKAWMVCKKPYIVPIPGSRKVERLRENVGAADIELTVEEVAAIDERLDHMEMSGVFAGVVENLSRLFLNGSEYLLLLQ